MRTAAEVYTLLEAYIVKVTTQHGDEFICIPRLQGFFTGAAIVAELTGITRDDRVVTVNLSRQQLDREAHNKGASKLKLYDADGCRIVIEFYEPVEYVEKL